MAVGPSRQPLGLGQARVKNGSARFSGIILKTENGFKLVNFISFEPQIRKMQTICQNAQKNHIYLLVLFYGQLKLLNCLYLINTKMAELNHCLENS